MPTPLVLLALTGCRCGWELGEACHPDSGRMDADGDGFFDDEDCDDSDPSVNPAADEVWYDGVDQDCDGRDDDQDGDGFELADDCDDTDDSVNPDAPELWYDGVDQDCDGRDDDQDGDGFELVDDCDDTDASAYPDAEEACDGVDNDCDGDIDEDQDGDGWALCDDCDDGDAEIHPDATELCDGADNDCDEDVDESADDDGDGWTVCDGDCDDDNGEVHPGATEICGNGVDDDCDGTPACGPWGDLSVDDDDGRIEGAGNYSGPQHAPVDLTGDGVGDIPAEDWTYGWDASGRLYVFEGPVSGTLGVADAYLTLEPDDPGDGIGVSYATHLDPLGDGGGGLAVGAMRFEQGSAGRVYVFSGPLDGSETLSDADATFDGVRDGDKAMRVSFADDLTGNGTVDLVIGAGHASAGGLELGALYVLDGPWSGDTSLAEADVVVSSMEGHSRIAEDYASTWALGDINGDAEVDLLVGAGGWSDQGYIHVLAGPLSGPASVADADATLEGVDETHQIGRRQVAGGDLDGDGYDDLLVGSYLADRGDGDVGACSVFLGPVTADFALTDALVTVWGTEPEGHLTCDDFAGDVDGDGRADLLLSAPSEHGADYYTGSLYLLPGPISGGTVLADHSARVMGQRHGALSGWSVGRLDLDGDAYSDFLSYSYDSSLGGVVHVWHGGGF